MTDYSTLAPRLETLAGAQAPPPPSAFGAGAHASQKTAGKLITQHQDGGFDFELAVPMENIEPAVQWIYTRPWTMADVRLWQEWEQIRKDGIGGGVQMLAGLSGLTPTQIEEGMHPNDLEEVIQFYEAELDRYRNLAAEQAAEKNADTEGRTFVFNVPVEADGRTYESLPFRYPTIKDTKEGARHELQIDQSIAIFAGMSGAPAAVFLKMHPYDFHRLEAWLGPLLSPRSPNSTAAAAAQMEKDLAGIVRSLTGNSGSGSL